MAACRQHHRWDWAGLFLILASAVLPCAIVHPAAAAEVKIGGRPLALDPPPGFCLFDKNRPQERKYIALSRRVYEPTEILVWLYGECRLRKQWLSRRSAIGLWGSLMVTKRQAVFHAAESMTRADFVAEMAGNGAWQAIHRDLEKRVRILLPNMRMNAINVLAKDDAALYIGARYSALDDKRNHVTILTVNAVTVINGLPVNIDLSSVDGQYSMSDLLERQKVIVRALIARNESKGMRDARVIDQPSTIIAAQ